MVVTQGIAKQGENVINGNTTNIFLMVLVLILLFVVNAGYGGGFSNVPTLLSDYFGMQNISAIHGITLSAWAIAGLTGNQVATLIVSKVGTPHDITVDGHVYAINPTGYQAVLYLTLALYIVSLIISFVMVSGLKKKEAK